MDDVRDAVSTVPAAINTAADEYRGTLRNGRMMRAALCRTPGVACGLLDGRDMGATVVIRPSRGPTGAEVVADPPSEIDFFGEGRRVLARAIAMHARQDPGAIRV